MITRSIHDEPGERTAVAVPAEADGDVTTPVFAGEHGELEINESLGGQVGVVVAAIVVIRARPDGDGAGLNDVAHVLLLFILDLDVPVTHVDESVVLDVDDGRLDEVVVKVEVVVIDIDDDVALQSL